MNTKVKVLENSQVELTVEVGAETIENAVNTAYVSMRKNFNIPGFRKGKVPRHMIEKMYGVEVFFNEAADNVINETFPEAVKENDLDMVVRVKNDDLKVREMSKDKMVYTAKVTVKPEVTLGQYKNLEIEPPSLEVTDEEIDMFINAEASKNAREIKIENRPIQAQDKVNIDFVGYVDDEPFEGGSANDYSLVIGSKSFVPGFEEQLIGKNLGDEIDVNITFPDIYMKEELAGKPALFKVKINEIEVTELPEINDDFAAEVSEFETLAEYRDDVRITLKEQKEEDRKVQISNLVVDKAIENATFDLPEGMIEQEIERHLSQFDQNMRKQGLTLEQYLEFTGLELDVFKENFRPQAIKQLSGNLVLEQIAKEENFVVSDEEYDKEISDRAIQYNVDADKFKEMINAEYEYLIKEDLKIQKAVNLLNDTAIIK